MLFPVINRFLHWFVVGLMTPIMVLMIISKGVPLESIGFIMAMLSTFVVVFEIPSGVLSDRIGRKRIYLISLAIFLLSFLVILLSRGFIAISLGFCVFGLARAFSSGSIESDFIDGYIATHGKDELHKIITGMNIGETLGLSMGALLGGYLPMLWQRVFPSDNIYNGNLIVQLATIGLLLLLTAIFARSIPQAESHESFGRFLGDTFTFLKSNQIIRILLVGIIVWGFSFTAIELYWQPQLKGILNNDQLMWIFGVVNSGYFLMSLLGSVFMNFLLSKVKMAQLLAIGLIKILIGATLIVLSLQSKVLGFSIFFLAIMGGNGMVNILEGTVFNARIPESKRASLLSLASFASQLGGIVASVSFSLLIGHFSISFIWVLAGSLFGLSSLLYVYLHRRDSTVTS